VRTSIIVVKGKNSKEYALNKVKGFNTLVLLTELEYLREYQGDERNVLVGLSTQELTKELLLKHDRIIVEPYNTEDFAAFMYLDVLKDYLDSEDKKMYVVIGNDFNVKIKRNKRLDKREWKENGLEIERFMLNKTSRNSK